MTPLATAWRRDNARVDVQISLELTHGLQLLVAWVNYSNMIVQCQRELCREAVTNYYLCHVQKSGSQIRVCCLNMCAKCSSCHEACANLLVLAELSFDVWSAQSAARDAFLVDAHS